MTPTTLCRLIVPVLLATLASACAQFEQRLEDGYQPGDLTGALLATQGEYCATADPYRRAALAAVLRSQGIGLPPSGACAQLAVLLPELDPADVEQAEADRRRARQAIEGATP